MGERAALASDALRALLAEGKSAEAGQLARRLLAETLGQQVASVAFTLDEYSLNSVSGRARLADGTERFFKFHQEDGERENVAEYYRARLLERAGLPVEVPLAVSAEPGKQMAVYELRTDPRMADVCLELERRDGPAATLPERSLRARRELDRRTGAVLLDTLRRPTAGAGSPAIHQLFGHRLVDADGAFPGGRYRAWYTEDASWSDLADHTWCINGVHYPAGLRELFGRAHRLLSPAALATEPVVTAHGDDHHGNVWHATDRGGRVELRLFDPAFAADDIPALLAPVKATYHNGLAHPMWLYHPAEAAQRWRIRARIEGGTVHVDTDATITPLRAQILDSAAELVWAPLIGRLHSQGLLRQDWRELVRAALFCCPTLVTNLLAAARPEPVRFLGPAMAVMAGCAPDGGTDPVAAFLDKVETDATA